MVALVLLVKCGSVESSRCKQGQRSLSCMLIWQKCTMWLFPPLPFFRITRKKITVLSSPYNLRVDLLYFILINWWLMQDFLPTALDGKFLEQLKLHAWLINHRKVPNLTNFMGNSTSTYIFDNFTRQCTCLAFLTMLTKRNYCVTINSQSSAINVRWYLLWATIDPVKENNH